MESIVYQLFIKNWQRKLFALIAAIFIWSFVNHSINATKTIPSVPIRVINLPVDKTIQGLLPNGILTKRVTLTLVGTKGVIDELEPGDIEVLLDASTVDSDEWVVRIAKKNLVSLNPDIDLGKHVSVVGHADLIIKFSKLMTAKVPVTVEAPRGASPPGYEFLDIWPQQMFHTLTGPEEDVQKIKDNGLMLSFDMADITKADLDVLKSSGHNDEVSFFLPKKSKQVAIPFRQNAREEINDPDSKSLRIDFLRKEILPLDKEVPIRIFYPIDDLAVLNPLNLHLALNSDMQEKSGITIFTKPLFSKDVSRLFLDVVRNSLEIVIIAAPKSKREVLAWSLMFISPRDLEDTYVAFSFANFAVQKDLVTGMIPKKQEEMLRKRFRDYMQRMTLLLANGKKLHIKSTIDGDTVRVVAY